MTRPAWIYDDPLDLMRRLAGAGARGTYTLAIEATAADSAACRRQALDELARLGRPATPATLRRIRPSEFADLALAICDHAVEAFARGGAEPGGSDAAVRLRRARRGLPTYVWGRCRRTYILLAAGDEEAARVEASDLVARLRPDLGWRTGVKRLSPDDGVALGDYLLVRNVRPDGRPYLVVRLRGDVLHGYRQREHELLCRAVRHGAGSMEGPLAALRREARARLAPTWVNPANLVEWDRAFLHDVGAMALSKSDRARVIAAVTPWRDVIAQRIRLTALSRRRAGRSV